MMQVDAVQDQSIQADLSKLQNEKPDEYSQLKFMGFARKWSIVIYPNAAAFPFSSKDELLDCLQNFCSQHQLTACLSPLHDRDLLLDGSPENPHYHFFTVSRSPCYAQLIGSLCYYLNGNLPIIKKVENELGYFRYFTHQDDLDKAEYSSEDIIAFNGYNPPCSGNGSTQSSTQELLELVDDFYSLSDLTSYIIHYRKDLFNVLLRSKNLISVYYTGINADKYKI